MVLCVAKDENAVDAEHFLVISCGKVEYDKSSYCND
jgi:hypothetical protein